VSQLDRRGTRGGATLVGCHLLIVSTRLRLVHVLVSGCLPLRSKLHHSGEAASPIDLRSVQSPLQHSIDYPNSTRGGNAMRYLHESLVDSIPPFSYSRQRIDCAPYRSPGFTPYSAMQSWSPAEFESHELIVIPKEGL